LSFFEWLMPFALAKRSHFVSGLGLGSGFSRGSIVVGAGRVASGPDDVRAVGSEKRVLSSAWRGGRACDVR
jgi:hypothetical protein